MNARSLVGQMDLTTGDHIEDTAVDGNDLTIDVFVLGKEEL